MKRLLLLLFLALPAFSQCTLTTFVTGTTIQAAPVNANFTSLNNCKTNRYSGSTEPGSIPSSRLGDIYTRTGTSEAYMCFTAGPCTAVAADNWVLLGTGGGGGGTVTVNLGGVLAANAVVTGAGFQKVQTISTFSRLDAAGNFTTPGFIQTGILGNEIGLIVSLGKPVAELPTCDSSVQGGRAFVTNATASTFFSVVVGGGSTFAPVFCDGTSWRIG